jgi:DNA-binding NarL/FixJ family response regulator
MQLFITPKTVEAHIRSIFGKLELPVDSSENRRVHAVLAFLQFKEGAPRPIQGR